MTEDIPRQLRPAIEHALMLLSYRPRSREEIRQRLRKRGWGAEQVEGVLTYLVERGYLDDLEFARAWVRDRNTLKPTGRRLLQRELLDKGLEEELISRVLEEVMDERTELKLAQSVASYKLTRWGKDAGDRIVRLLGRRGFSLDIAKLAVASVEESVDIKA